MKEFPHTVKLLKHTEPEPDGGGGFIPGTGGWTPYETIDGFLDTPSSREIYQAEQLQHPFDRHLYFSYRTDITTKMRVACEGDTYELSKRPLDQGGQHKIMRVDLRLVSNG